MAPRPQRASKGDRVQTNLSRTSCLEEAPSVKAMQINPWRGSWRCGPYLQERSDKHETAWNALDRLGTMLVAGSTQMPAPSQNTQNYPKTTSWATTCGRLPRCRTPKAPIYDRPPRDAPSPDATDFGGVHIAELDQRPNPIGSPIAQSAPQAKCLKSGA